jgi:hypothetical protein
MALLAAFLKLIQRDPAPHDDETLPTGTDDAPITTLPP